MRVKKFLVFIGVFPNVIFGTINKNLKIPETCWKHSQATTLCCLQFWSLARADSRKRPALVATTLANSRGGHLYERFDWPFSNVILSVRKGQCSLRTFDKHSRNFAMSQRNFAMSQRNFAMWQRNVVRIFANFRFDWTIGVSKFRRSSNENSFRPKFRYISSKSSEIRRKARNSFAFFLHSTVYSFWEQRWNRWNDQKC